MSDIPPLETMWSISHVRVGGDLGGVLAVIGTVLVVTLGIPGTTWVFGATAGAGLVCAVVLLLWHRRHPQATQPPNTIDGH